MRRYTRAEVEAELRQTKEEGDGLPYFSDANLIGVDLSGLDFRDGYFDLVDLSRTDLRNANLTGVVLYGTVTFGAKGLVSIPNIGSRGDTLYAWRREVAPGRYEYVFSTGCFEGNEEQFRAAIKEKRRDDGPDYAPHAKAYRAAIKKMKKLLDEQYAAG